MLSNRFIASAFAVIFLACSVTYAQENSNEEPSKGVHPYDLEKNTNVAPEISHWSLLFDAGFNLFDGDFNTEMDHAVYAPSLGLGVEYTFNPYIGLGLNYMFDSYRVKGVQGQAADVLLKGNVHKVGLYLPVDLVSCFAPRATKRLFNLQLIAGGGFAWYKNSAYYAQADRGNTLNAEAQETGEYKSCPYYNFGANLEFNLGRSIGLGLRGMYYYFTRDDIDGRYGGASVNNDGVIDITLSLRYKIDAQKRSHTRNIPTLDIEKDIARGTYGNDGKPVSAEDVAREIADNNLLPIGKDTVYIVHRDTIVQTNAVAKEDYHFVYFDNGESKLTDQALISIQQLAAQLQRDTTLHAFITGYCDNTGSDDLNNTLSEKRAEAVRSELIEEYGISEDRVFGHGEGRIVGKRSKASYTPNRRVEVQLLSGSEFEQKKQEVGADENEPQNVASENVIVVPQGATLAKLAGEYYGDATKWRHIYDANRDVISNPDVLWEGMKLVIPTLN